MNAQFWRAEKRLPHAPSGARFEKSSGQDWLAKYSLGARIPPHGNPDNDPATTYEEYVADTSPIDGNDFFHITAFGDGSILFNSSSNRFYSLSCSTNLNSNS